MLKYGCKCKKHKKIVFKMFLCKWNMYKGEKMYCKKCGEKLNDNAIFCGKCGIKIEKNSKRKTGSFITNKLLEEKTKKNKLTGKKILLVGIGLFILVITATCMKKYEKSNGVEQCKNILDEEIMEQDDNIRSSVFEFLNEEGMDGIDDSLVDEIMDALYAGRSDVKYEVISQEHNIIEIEVSVKNADLEETIINIVADAVSEAMTMDRKTLINGSIKGLFKLRKVDLDNPDDFIGAVVKKTSDIIANEVKNTEKVKATGTVYFEKVDGDWEISSEDMENFWNLYCNFGLNDTSDY